MTRLLVVRLDSLGDMLICGPAIRALAEVSEHLTVLAGPGGAPAARMLPGVDAVLTWPCPWIDVDAPTVTNQSLGSVIDAIRAVGADRAVVLTSFHQSALPTALVLQLAGIGDIAAISTDFPGSLLTRRLAEPADGPEPVRMLRVAEAAGGHLPCKDDGRLRVNGARTPSLAPGTPYVVVHPGVSAPARAYPPELWSAVVTGLVAAGWSVAVTGTTGETALVHRVAAEALATEPLAVTLAIGLGLPELAGLLRQAETVVVANTGPAHLAAAVATPVVSLFAPVVPALRWSPFGVEVALLGDQNAACRDSRARSCPVAGHPCLSDVQPGEVVAAVSRLASVCKPPALAGVRR